VSIFTGPARKSRIVIHSALVCRIIAGVIVLASPANAAAQTCIVPETSITAQRPFRELSGVAWDPVLQLAIGIRDERLDYPGYEIFAFDPNTVSDDGCHRAVPLLSGSLSREFQLDDLEAITRLPNGDFFALSSLSLGHVPSPRDRWSRFRGVRFTLTTQDGSPTVDRIERISSDSRPDLREWVISSSGRSWQDNDYRGRAEAGGINVEGLTHTADGQLIVGFRAPLGGGPSALVLFLQTGAADVAPQTVRWDSIDVSGLPGNDDERARGVRGMTRISQAGEPDRYAIVVGHTGPRHDRLRIALWQPSDGTVLDRGELPDGYVGEGITLIDRDGDRLEILLLDDLLGSALRMWIDDWPND